MTRTHVIKMEHFVFKWFPSLIHLDLSSLGDARIDLSEGTFYGLLQLKTLLLRNTMLTSIPSVSLQSFAQTCSLKQLDLSENMLTGLFPDDAFASVTSLEHLDLSYNPISYLNRWVERLTNLTHLFLNGGNIHFFFVQALETPLYSLIEVRLDQLTNDAPYGFGKVPLSQTAPNQIANN